MTSEDNHDWQPIKLEKALRDYTGKLNVAHCMLYFSSFKSSRPASSSSFLYFAFMQMRFDGFLGFPGGIVDEDLTDINSVIDALKRELLEEINNDGKIEAKDHLSSYYNKEKDIVSHFFAKEISYEEACDLERKHLLAEDFGRESLGIFRVPIGSSYDRGSVFMRNFWFNFARQKFSGNVKNQIVDSIVKHGIMNKHDLNWIKANL